MFKTTFTTKRRLFDVLFWIGFAGIFVGGFLNSIALSSFAFLTMVIAYFVPLFIRKERNE